MRDITAKRTTLRKATAIGKVVCSPETITRIKGGTVPKGNILDFARAAGFLAAKQTPALIPHCHPISIDGMEVNYEFEDNAVVVTCSGKTLGRTGLEVEMVNAVAIVCVTLYDVLKPIDTDIEITGIKLLEKSGGKSDKARYAGKDYTCAVLVCSDSTAAGQREDKSGLIIKEFLKENGAEVVEYTILPDEKDQIQNKIKGWAKEGVDFVFSTGGTGLSPRDNTVDAVREIIEKDAPAITESMRVYGGDRTPLAMMSRSTAGVIGKTFVVTLPGSSNGARESMEALMPWVFHAKAMINSEKH